MGETPDTQVSFCRSVRRNQERLLRNHQLDPFIYFPTRIIEKRIDERGEQAAWIMFQHIKTNSYWPNKLIWRTAVWEYTVWWQCGKEDPRCVLSRQFEITRDTPDPLPKDWSGRHVRNLSLSPGILEVRVEGGWIHRFRRSWMRLCA